MTIWKDYLLAFLVIVAVIAMFEFLAVGHW